MRVLGLEGTAWAASAAIYSTESEHIEMETRPYRPESGGIHPREAAEHMAEAMPTVIAAVLESADGDIDAVAFSRGPGLGPCLRIVATAARTMAQRLAVPLVGVNHMVAHAEIGRHRSGFDDPICLNASGANAHVLAYHRDRYRILGETMDTGIGNAIDKFTRHLGWSHPGGPKVESAAEGGEYLELPYVVKGMDFSFAGITSAAIAAVDDGAAVEDVCFSLQETIFAMVTEVTERALSLRSATELVLGGGVGQNRRLQDMLRTMCADRGAEFYAPEARLLRDNAGMIAVLGARMAANGAVLEIEDSTVDPDFRPDDVPIPWREGATDLPAASTTVDPLQGAEATVRATDGRLVKTRQPKRYRHPDLDERLRGRRTAAEARLTSLARRIGVPTPVVFDVDPVTGTIEFETVGSADLRDRFEPDRIRAVGRHLATLHAEGIVHGDPTPRNVRVGRDRTYLIDFGLGYHSDHVEDRAMDLHVFLQAATGTADDPDQCRAALLEGYRERGDSTVLDRLADIEGRGRYQ